MNESEYVPYGPEWEKEMNKWGKKQLIELLRKVLRERYAETQSQEDAARQDEASGEPGSTNSNLETFSCDPSYRRSRKNKQ